MPKPRNTLLLLLFGFPSLVAVGCGDDDVLPLLDGGVDGASDAAADASQDGSSADVGPNVLTDAGVDSYEADALVLFDAGSDATADVGVDVGPPSNATCESALPLDAGLPFFVDPSRGTEADVCDRFVDASLFYEVSVPAGHWAELHSRGSVATATTCGSCVGDWAVVHNDSADDVTYVMSIGWNGEVVPPDGYASFLEVAPSPVNGSCGTAIDVPAGGAVYEGLSTLGAGEGISYSGACSIPAVFELLWYRVMIPAGQTLEVTADGGSGSQPPQAYIVDGCSAPGACLGATSFDDVLSYENPSAAPVTVYVGFSETSNLSARLTLSIR